MKGLLREYLNMFTLMAPYLAVFWVLKYMISVQEKRLEERKKEREKGIIRTHYVIKSEIILVIIFIVLTLFSGICAFFCYLTVFAELTITQNMEADVWCIYLFAIFALLGIAGTWNTLVWKLEVNGEEIAWRSTFGIVRKFRFEDITECEIRKHSIRVFVNNKKMFHIDDNIDCEEFMEDVKRHGIRETDAFIKKLEKRVGKKRW